MTIPFLYTPGTTRNPGFYFEVDPSKANSAQPAHATLILAQPLPASAAAQVPALLNSTNTAISLAGAGSPLALMAAQYRARDPFGQLWGVPVTANGAGTASTVAVTLTGPSTAAGTLSAYVCGVQVPVLVTSGQAATAIATALAAAINANPNLPVSATATTATVTCTAKVMGPLDLDVRMNYYGTLGGEAFPAGVGASTITFTVGTGSPDLTNALLSLGEVPFDLIIIPYTDTATLDAVKGFLSDATGRWLSTRLLFGHGFAAIRGTLGTVVTALTARNDQHMTIMPFNDSPTPAWLWAADLAGSIANSLRNDPGMPLQKLAMGVLAPPPQSRFVFSDRDTLLVDGGSTYEVDQDGTVRTSRIVTTYQKNAFNVPDTAFLDAETPFQLADVIQRFRADFSSVYARKKIVANGTRLGQNNADTVTPQIVATHCIALYRQMEADGRVQDSTTFEQKLVAEYVGLGRLNLLLPITLAQQLRIIASLVQFMKP